MISKFPWLCRSDSLSILMANTKYAYVRDFELPDPLLPDTFILFRLDGHSFHRLDIYLFISTVFMLKPKNCIDSPKNTSLQNLMMFEPFN
jgi:hypothetical protein